MKVCAGSEESVHFTNNYAFTRPSGMEGRIMDIHRLFVGFVYVFMSKVLLFVTFVPLYKVRSKKWISFGEHPPREFDGRVESVAVL